MGCVGRYVVGTTAYGVPGGRDRLLDCVCGWRWWPVGFVVDLRCDLLPRARGCGLVASSEVACSVRLTAVVVSRNVGTMQTSFPQMQTRPQCECNTQKPGIPIQAEHICNVNTSNEQRSVMKEQAVHKLRLCDQGVCEQGAFGQCASQQRGPSSCEDGWPSGVVVPDEGDL